VCSAGPWTLEARRSKRLVVAGQLSGGNCRDPFEVSWDLIRAAGFCAGYRHFTPACHRKVAAVQSPPAAVSGEAQEFTSSPPQSTPLYRGPIWFEVGLGQTGGAALERRGDAAELPQLPLRSGHRPHASSPYRLNRLPPTVPMSKHVTKLPASAKDGCALPS